MKKSSITQALSPWTVVLLLVLALIIFIPAINEYFSGKRDLVHLWHEQGGLLSETILRSADRIVAFDENAETSIKERLLDLGHYISQLDSLNYPDTRTVRQYVRRQGRMTALFFNRDGKLQAMGRNRNLVELEPLLITFIQTFPPNEKISFLPENPSLGFKGPGVIIRRVHGNGYILLMSAQRMNRSRPQDRPPLEGWIQRLTNHASIEYIILQKEGKVIAGSGPELSSLDTDASISPHPQWKLLEISQKRIFEYSQAGPAGLRVIIGLPALALERLQNNLISRLLISSLVLLILGSVLVVYLIKRQNYSFLQSRYAHIQTYNTSVLENIEEGIIVLDQDRTISVFNQAASSLFKIAVEDVIGKNIHQIHAPIPANFIDGFSEFKAMKETPAFIQRNGKHIELLISAHAVRLKETESDQQIYIILLRNNTTQRELETVRNRKSKLIAMGELASRVAHEIRNPLNGIAVLAQRIQKELVAQTKEKEFTQMTQSIRDESNRINEIIEAFLFYARTPELKLQEISIKSWCESIVPLLEALGNVMVDIPFDNKNMLKIDADQMKQVLINLVKNAVEASPEGSKVLVRIKVSDNLVHIYIEDRGIGLPDEMQDKLFDLYFTTKEKGSGLGLSIVEKIVSAHGGNIQFESPYLQAGESVQGARFEISLPI